MVELQRAMTMSPTLLFLCLLLLLPQLGTSSHVSYTLGSRQFIVRSSADSQASSSSAPASCSSNPSGVDRLPVVHHRLSPCSPMNTAGEQSDPVPTDAVFRRDVRRVRSLLADRPSAAAAAASLTGDVGAAPAPAPAAAGGVTVPARGFPAPSEPGVQDYSVLVGYGTPAQPLRMALDTVLGTTLVRCKPCASGAASCDPAFDTSASSTFAHVPCGSPDCRSNCSGAVCPVSGSGPALILIKGAFVQDVLTLTTSAGGVAGVVHDFTFGCVEVDQPSPRSSAGVLDLSRDSRSVVSRLATPGGAPAFSYCLPRATGSRGGFLSIGTNRPQHSGARAVDAPLVFNPEFPKMYFVELVGMSVGGKDLAIPPAADMAKTTAIDVMTAFTFLRPSVYVPLRDAFRELMSEYPRAPAFHRLDTCYNFTGLSEIAIPLVTLRFGNGESLVLDAEQMLYFEDPSAGPLSVACLAFVAFPSDTESYSVIGTLAQSSTEVVYDVSGGKLGFIPRSC